MTTTQALGAGSRIKHEDFGIGAIVKVSASSYFITFMQHGYQEVPRDMDLEVIDLVAPTDDMVSFAVVEDTLKTLLEKWGALQAVVPLGSKWEGGTMILKPADESLKSKEIPIEAFFHKIVMVRDRLRVMEQRINSNKSMSDEEKVNMQQYITRIYGSLTTFNVLFKTREDGFIGMSQ